MKKRILLGVVLVMMLCGAVGAFAEGTSWMVSHNKAGQINVYGGLGFYGYGFDLVGGAEYIIQDFNIGVVPFQWGIMAQAILGIPYYRGSGLDWGAAPLASLHWGTDFGGLAKFDVFISLGLGLFGGTYYGPFGLGFASFGGFEWMFSKELGLLAEAGYIGGTGASAIGVVWKL